MHAPRLYGFIAVYGYDRASHCHRHRLEGETELTPAFKCSFKKNAPRHLPTRVSGSNDPPTVTEANKKQHQDWKAVIAEKTDLAVIPARPKSNPIKDVIAIAVSTQDNIVSEPVLEQKGKARTHGKEGEKNTKILLGGQRA